MIKRKVNPNFFQNNVNVPSDCVNDASRSIEQTLKAARKTGILNLSNRNIIKCPVEIFKVPEILDSDEKFWEVAPTTKIDLSHNMIRAIPDSFDANVTNSLQIFLCRDNQLTQLPQSLTDCQHLKCLDFSINNILTVNIDVNKLSSLRELLGFENKLTEVPRDMNMCQELQSIDLHHNKIVSLPDSFHFQSLIRLNIKNNLLDSIPQSVALMTSLEFIDLSENNLTTFPDLSRLQRLTYLDLTQNQLISIPSLPISGSLDRLHLGYNKISNLDMESLNRINTTLTDLILHDNCLFSIPSEISAFAKLKAIDFSNNSISDIPAAVGWMPSLQRFQIEGNPIRTIRRTLLSQSTEDLKKYLKTRGPPYNSTMASNLTTTSIVSYDGITFQSDKINNEEILLVNRVRDMINGNLDLTDLKLTALPFDTLCPLIHTRNMSESQVISLNLSQNTLTIRSLQDSNFLLFKGLIVLNLSSNSLSKISTIGGAGSSPTKPSLPSSLRIIDVSGNALTYDSFRAFLTTLDPDVQLVEFNLSNNNLVRCPDQLSSYSALRTLRIANNKLESIDDIKFAALLSLENFDAGDNKITSIEVLASIPPTIKTINLQNNNIMLIPPQLSLYPNLTYLGIQGNPQKMIRTNIIQNTESILKFLRNKLPAGIQLNTVDIKNCDRFVSSKSNTTLQSPAVEVINSKFPHAANTTNTSTQSCVRKSQLPEPVDVIKSLPTSASISALGQLKLLQDNIERLETELDHPSTTTTRKSQIKKDLATCRAQVVKFH